MRFETFIFVNYIWMESKKKIFIPVKSANILVDLIPIIWPIVYRDSTTTSVYRLLGTLTAQAGILLPNQNIWEEQSYNVDIHLADQIKLHTRQVFEVKLQIEDKALSGDRYKNEFKKYVPSLIMLYSKPSIDK